MNQRTELITLQGADTSAPVSASRRFADRAAALRYIASLPGYRRLDENLWERGATDFLVLRSLELN